MINTIYLLSDFGYKDYYVAAMKSTIISINPDIKYIIDLTHEVSPWNIEEGAFILWQFVRNLDSKSIIVGVVDPGVGSGREDIVIKTVDEIYFIGPNNGLFYPVLDIKSLDKVYLIDISNRRFFPEIAPTFYGRDVYARSAAYISKGIMEHLVPIEKSILTKLDIFKIERNENLLKGKILHIDRFGNLITNIKCKLISLEEDKFFKIIYKEKVYKLKFVRTFSDLSYNELGILCGSSGLYEIVCNMRRAADVLRASAGDSISLVL